MAKPAKENIQPDTKSSFRLKYSLIKCMDSPWHFHEEYELLYIIKGHGTRIVGNHVSEYGNGDMVFMGSNIPHVWKNPDSFYDPGKKKKDVEVICLQFNEKAFGNNFFHIPEMELVRQLLKKSGKGISIEGETKQQIAELLRQMLSCEYVNRFVLLMEVLNKLATSREYKLLSSVSYSHYSFHSETDRLEKVFSYVSKNFKSEINLSEVAEHVGMSETGFCKFFKKTTLKNFTAYLNEVRINYACQLLQNDKYSVSQIMFKCGFKNFSHFNKTFKKLRKCTPMQYKIQFRNTI